MVRCLAGLRSSYGLLRPGKCIPIPSTNSSKVNNKPTTQLAIVYATSNLKINIDIFCRIVAGFVFEGKVLANIWFFDIGYITTIKGLYFAEDMKLCDYCKVPSPTCSYPSLTHRYP